MQLESRHLGFAEELLFELLSPPLPLDATSATGEPRATASSAGRTVVLSSSTSVPVGVMVVVGVAVLVMGVVDVVDAPVLLGSVAVIVFLINELTRENRLGGSFV